MKLVGIVGNVTRSRIRYPHRAVPRELHACRGALIAFMLFAEYRRRGMNENERGRDRHYFLLASVLSLTSPDCRRAEIMEFSDCNLRARLRRQT